MRPPGSVVPTDVGDADVRIGRSVVRLTHLRKPFWSRPTVTKGDLLRYYAAVSAWLLPHLRGRAMVMKRYPNGAGAAFFFMKHVPDPHPPWLTLCAIKHSQGNVVTFPVVDSLASLLWTVNLGCIDLNPWYARCDDTHRPDYLNFDLDPVPGATFARVCEAALIVRDSLEALGMPSFAKTTGSRGIHVYVPIKRGPQQEEVWRFSKALSMRVAELHPAIITAEYAKSKRPRGRVLMDYNQNAWARTLASVYSVRPAKKPTVSAPVAWKEIERGIRIDDFRLDNMADRLRIKGDLWRPLLARTGRVDLARHL